MGIRSLSSLALAAFLCMGISDCNIPWPPNPEPTPTPSPTPEPTPTPTPEPPWECSLPMPECGEVHQQCSSPESPCWHNPTTDPHHCEEAPACPTPTPPPPPIPTECLLPTPTAKEMKAQGLLAEVRPERHGANISATPWGAFGRILVNGKSYYCDEAVAWPEACREGRLNGPVAPEGHPQRLVCEQKFLQGCGPKFSMAECSGEPWQCPISFDPFYVINGVNQNHPINVIAGCNGEDWERINGVGQPIKGSFWMATAHGKGTIKACNSDESICTVSSFIVDY